MAAGAAPEDFFADTEPFSPSIFLDLPPTPRPHPDGDGDGEEPASPEDLIIPFISRMLMEEDIDDKFFYLYPDHPALLQAQQPFAQILSDATTGSSEDANTTLPGSAATLSPSSSEDPIKPSSQSPPYSDMGVCLDDFTTDDVDAFFLPAQDGATTGFQQNRAQLVGGSRTGAGNWALLDDADEEETKTKATLPAADGDIDHAALASAFFSDHNGGNMNIFNLAFLKGMEEAKKFLPTNNSLLIDLKATPEQRQLVSGSTMGQVKEDEESGNGRGCKNRHNLDVLEAEMGRNRKMMVPEPEDTGKMVDEMIFNGYDLWLAEMKNLHITMGSEAEINTRKGNAKLTSHSHSDEAVDLCTLLTYCAHAVAMDNHRSATELLRKIKRHSSPSGDATQRLAHCFAEGLEARLAGSGSQVYKSLIAKRTSVVDFLKAYRLYLAACCFKMMAFKFSNMTIHKAISGKKKVHIVDYGINYGLQWPNLLRFLATRKGGPPEVRITGIDLPQPGFRPAARLEQTGRRLDDCARHFGVPFKFHSIVANWETIHVDDLNIDPDEVLIVNSIIHFGNLMDEAVGIDSQSPRDVVLSNIRKMRPNVFILFVMNGLYSTPFFTTRFRELLFHYSALFDMLDATAPRDSDLRNLIERDLFSQCALNVIACEGSDRVERPETYKKWHLRNHQAGLRQLPLDPDIVKTVRETVKEQYHKDFVIDVDHRWLLEGWKGRILYAMSTWTADDAILGL